MDAGPADTGTVPGTAAQEAIGLFRDSLDYISKYRTVMFEGLIDPAENLQCSLSEGAEGAQ
ncbi:hypothetical protein AUQ37_00020 [Candidatus Methanomethylophilus sp. 1R26]|nr:hypothetical protein AUQ37_00020 [Candidatus Methanomethylophilus sp. 1R26]